MKMAPAITARAIYSKATKSRSSNLLPPSPPAEKSTTSEDQAGQASTGNGARHCGNLRSNAAGKLVGNEVLTARSLSERMSVGV
jgi:hypothetical protein